jgi:hypothetical protein
MHALRLTAKPAMTHTSFCLQKKRSLLSWQEQQSNLPADPIARHRQLVQVQTQTRCHRLCLQNNIKPPDAARTTLRLIACMPVHASAPHPVQTQTRLDRRFVCKKKAKQAVMAGMTSLDKPSVSFVMYWRLSSMRTQALLNRRFVYRKNVTRRSLPQHSSMTASSGRTPGRGRRRSVRSLLNVLSADKPD